MLLENEDGRTLTSLTEHERVTIVCSVSGVDTTSQIVLTLHCDVAILLGTVGSRAPELRQKIKVNPQMDKQRCVCSAINQQTSQVFKNETVLDVKCKLVNFN